MKWTLTFSVLASCLAFAVQDPGTQRRMLAASEMDAIMGGGCFRDDTPAACTGCPGGAGIGPCTGGCTLKPGAQVGSLRETDYDCSGSGQVHWCFNSALYFGKVRDVAYPELVGYKYTTQTIVHCQNVTTCNAACVKILVGEEQEPAITCDTTADPKAADETGENTTYNPLVTDNTCPGPPAP